MTVKPNRGVPAYELFRPGDQVIVHQLENPQSGATVTGSWPAEVVTAHLERTVVVATDHMPTWAKTEYGKRHSVAIKRLTVVSKVPRGIKNPNYTGMLGKSGTSVYASQSVEQTPEQRQKIIEQIKNCAQYGMTKRETCTKLGMTMTTLVANCTKENINFMAERWKYLCKKVPPMIARGVKRTDVANELHCSLHSIAKIINAEKAEARL